MSNDKNNNDINSGIIGYFAEKSINHPFKTSFYTFILVLVFEFVLSKIQELGYQMTIIENILPTLISAFIIFVFSEQLVAGFKKVVEETEGKRDMPGDFGTLNKKSKNYGKSGNWIIRTFYTFTSSQLMNHEYIKFSIRGVNNIIKLSTRKLIEGFSIESSEDGAGKIRMYIFQDEKDKKFYITRFGKKLLDKPKSVSFFE